MWDVWLCGVYGVVCGECMWSECGAYGVVLGQYIDIAIYSYSMSISIWLA